MTTADLSCATPAAAIASILDLRIYLHIVTRPLIDRMTSVYLNHSETTPALYDSCTRVLLAICCKAVDVHS